MTDEDLRDLLQERVADVTTTDLSATAWRDGRRIRARRRLGAVAGVTAAVLVVAGVAVAIGGQPATDSDPGPSTSSPSVDEADAVVNGAPVFWSPDPAEEGELDPPAERGLLPETVDLGDSARPVEDAPIASASAAFGIFDGSRLDRVLLVSPEGDRTLDVSGLGLVTKPNGYRLPPVSDTMLSPSGTALLFPQDGHLMLYTLASGQWSRIDTGRSTVGASWVNDELISLPLGQVTLELTGEVRSGTSVTDIETPPQVVEATAHGPAVPDPALQRTAQAFGYGSSVPTREPTDFAQPETVVVAPTLGPPTILAITTPHDSPGRYKDCCPVAGWLDDDTVVYESRGADPKLIGWEVGSHDFSLVSRIVGLTGDDSYVASFADLSATARPAGEAEDAEATADADATAQGVPVWWSPDLAQELELPWIDEGASVLPRSIDAVTERPDVADEPIDRAVAAFALDPLRPDRVTLLAPDGAFRSLDISSLDPLRDPDGNASAAATATMLSPDGRNLVFVQRGHLMVYALGSGEWTRIDTGDASTEHVTWADDETLYLPPTPTGGRGPLFDLAGEPSGADDLAPPAKAFEIARAFDNAEGPWRTNRAGDVAQSWGMGGPFLPVRDPGTYLSGPAYLAVVGGSGTQALAFMTAIDDYRFLDAPRVAGWLDDDTVVYESLADDRDLLVAWDVGTRTFRRVAAITGSTTSSFADLQQR